MRKFRFYLKPNLEIGNLEIEGQTAHYIAHVLRLPVGANLVLFDGSGYEFLAEISVISKNKVNVVISKKQFKDTESVLRVHLGQVISKGDKMDLIMQKACELGASEITPLFSTRCEVKLSGVRLAKKMEHWRQITISAAEQCGRCVLPVIHEPQYLTDWLKQVEAEVKLIFQPSGINLNKIKPMQSLAVTIGAEGGFTADEVLCAQNNDFILAGLGTRILRTETATITTLSIAQHLWGDL